MNDMHVNEPLLREIIKTQATQAGKISAFDNKLDDVEKGIVRILSYIENDNSTGTKGVISKQKDMSKRISKIENELENTQLKNKTLIGVASFIGAAVMAIIGLIAKFTTFK